MVTLSWITRASRTLHCALDRGSWISCGYGFLVFFFSRIIKHNIRFSLRIADRSSHRFMVAFVFHSLLWIFWISRTSDLRSLMDHSFLVSFTFASRFFSHPGLRFARLRIVLVLQDLSSLRTRSGSFVRSRGLHVLDLFLFAPFTLRSRGSQFALTFFMVRLFLPSLDRSSLSFASFTLSLFLSGSRFTFCLVLRSSHSVSHRGCAWFLFHGFALSLHSHGSSFSSWFITHSHGFAVFCAFTFTRSSLAHTTAHLSRSFTFSGSLVHVYASLGLRTLSSRFRIAFGSPFSDHCTRFGRTTGSLADRIIS